jgi:SAM-dependent methyltransferase
MSLAIARHQHEHHMDGRARLRKLVRRSEALSTFGKHAIGRYEALRDRRLTREASWARRSSHELSFWADSLKAGMFADLLDPTREVQATSLRRALGELPPQKLSILDVGSGPLTAVGHVFPGKTLSIVATDALAEQYVAILEASRVSAPILPLACPGEDLASMFATHRFDVAYSQNALDHMSEPLAILSHMLGLITPSGRVALNHFRNEGARNGYVGLHFWNIDYQDGSLVFWNRETRHDVSAALAVKGYAAECWFEIDKWGEHIHSLIGPVF